VGPTSGIPRLNSFFCRIDTTSNANAFPLSGFFAVACGGAEAPACADAIGTPNAMQTITAAKLKLCASRIMVSTILFSKFWHDLMLFPSPSSTVKKKSFKFPGKSALSSPQTGSKTRIPNNHAPFRAKNRLLIHPSPTRTIKVREN
jgi:hypothetical protein